MALRGLKDILCCAVLDGLTGVHDHDLFAGLGHNTQIVGDEDHGGVQPLLQFVDQAQQVLGVGVAESSGFINVALKKMLRVTPKKLLTPMLIFVAMFSHVAADAGYVLVIPLGAIIFMSAGRHPLVGIAAAFSGVSGGFAANMVPTGNDALLQGFTQAAAQLLDSSYTVNTLCNLFFGIASSIIITLVGWFLFDQKLDLPALLGIGLIAAGVIVMNTFSKTMGH